MANLSFNFSGERSDVCYVLRRFSADTILKRISAEAIKLEKKTDKADVAGVNWVEYDLMNASTRITQKKKTIITIWGLIDLAYYAIVASNDYRGLKSISDEEFYLLFDAVESLKQKAETEFLDNLESGSRELYMYLWGFVGEQIKVQEQGKCFDSIGRELYILFESSKQLGDSAIDISRIVFEETGVNWEKVICSLLLGWACSTVNCRITEPAFAFDDPELLSKEDYLKVIAKYSIDYDTLRKSNLKRQTLYTRPYIITQKNETLGILPYLNLRLYEHSILWIVRDNYKKTNNQGFTSYFGQCFEKYFEELLACYLRDGEYEKLLETETKGKRADWRLKIDGYGFLVEQKSALIRLGAKQQAPSIIDLEDFAKKNIIKAIRQLDNTEKELVSGQYIKIILLYDDYLNPEVLEQVFLMEECEVESDNHYWLVTIEEMEILLGICAKDRTVFDSIIEEKNCREISHSNNGKTLWQIMKEYGFTNNEFIKHEGIAHYRDLASGQLLKLLKRPS